MMLPPDLKVTDEVLLRGALLFFVLDLLLVPLVTRLARPATFLKFKRALPAATLVYWWLLWTWVLSWGWDAVYQYLFPTWSRAWLPLLQGILFSALSFLSWWLAVRLSRNPAPLYCLLGGLWGMTSHVWAVSMGVVEKPPLLQGASPAAAVFIAIFEFIFYFSVVLLATFSLWHGWGFAVRRLHGRATLPSG
ncbi:MAG: hypothetical protein ACM3JD_14850 [Rudaea sp.]